MKENLIAAKGYRQDNDIQTDEPISILPQICQLTYLFRWEYGGVVNGREREKKRLKNLRQVDSGRFAVNSHADRNRIHFAVVGFPAER